MTDITVGQVSGLISFGVLISSVILPLMIIAILVGFLKETNSAVTWSVVCRFAQATWWPTILRSDSTAVRSVDRKVLFLTISSTLSVIILGVAGVVAPLGLDEGIVATDPRDSQFVYRPDEGSVGKGTLQRDGYEYSRFCGAARYIACPSQEFPRGYGFDPKYRSFFTKKEDEDFLENNKPALSSKIPANLTSAFRVPREFSLHNTIAGPFDVQYRDFSYIVDRNPNKATGQFDMGEPITVGNYRSYGQNILSSDYQVIEGGVVDRINGGYGFLRHARPKDVKYRADWKADLLWMAPESACVDNNVSIVYKYAYNTKVFDAVDDSPTMSEASIRDYGGLKFMPEDYPFIDLNKSQEDPLLYDRAWKAAVLSNFNIYVSLNLTRDKMPKETDKTLSFNITGFLTDKFSLEPDIPTIQNMAYSLDNGLLPIFTDLAGINTSSIMNPGTLSRGFGGGDPTDINTVHTDSYFIISPGMPLPGPSPQHERKEAGTRWEHRVYTCATAITATIKRVTFSYNATSDILGVLNVEELPKTEPTPLWGMESAGWNISDQQPVWGIVPESQKKNPAIVTVQKDKFYIPAGSASLFGEILGSLALPSVGITAARKMFDELTGRSSSLQDTGRYTGSTNYETYRRWVESTKSADQAWKMMHVIWADIMGNYVLGTNSIPEDDQLPVIIWERRILYDLKYAIPAIIFLAIFVVTLITLQVLIVTKKTSIHNVRQLLNMTGTGRAITMTQSPGAFPPNASTKEWLESAGKEIIIVPYRTVHDQTAYEGFVGGAQNVYTSRAPGVHEKDVRVQQDGVDYSQRNQS